MDRKLYSAEKIILKLRETEVLESKGFNQPETVKRLEVYEQILIRWRKEFGNLRVDQAKLLKDLEKENSWLK